MEVFASHWEVLGLLQWTWMSRNDLWFWQKSSSRIDLHHGLWWLLGVSTWSLWDQGSSAVEDWLVSSGLLLFELHVAQLTKSIYLGTALGWWAELSGSFWFGSSSVNAFLPSCRNTGLGTPGTGMGWPSSCQEGKMQEPTKLLFGGIPRHICLLRYSLAGGTLVWTPSCRVLFLFLEPWHLFVLWRRLSQADFRTRLWD